MDTLRVNFVDFWPNFVKTDNYFYHLLSTEYRVIIDDERPDVLFHSVDYQRKQEHLKYNNDHTIKIFYTGECVRADFNNTHFALTFDYSSDPREYRLPLWVLTLNWFNTKYDENRDISYLHDVEALLSPKDPEAISKDKSRFCSFVASSPRGKRCEFLPQMLKRRHVDCAGRLFNNISPIEGRGDQIHKINFLTNYKFNICFENESFPGYVTEKIVHSMYSNCIPIYWGCPHINREFNKESFIYANDFQSDEELIDHILAIDSDPESYEHKLSQPWFASSSLPESVMPHNILKFIKKALG